MRWLAPLACLAALGCGGRVIDDGSGGDPGGRAGSGPSGLRAGSTPLPPCNPGFDPTAEPERRCEWVDNRGLCYDTKLDACACACRGITTPICSSPLLDVPPEAIPVDCF